MTLVEYDHGGCAISDTLTICRPPRLHRRAIHHCPTCKRRRRFVIHWQGMWYGHYIVCVGCGDSWQDGERAERPFARGWRQKAITQARKDWATAVTPAQYKAAIRHEVNEYEQRRMTTEHRCTQCDQPVPNWVQACQTCGTYLIGRDNPDPDPVNAILDAPAHATSQPAQPITPGSPTP